MKSLKLNCPTNVYGFTLIEILLTMAIIAIVSTYGFINLIASREKANLIGAAAQLSVILDTARDYSVRNTDQKYYGVKFDNGTPITPTLMCYSCSPPESPIKTVALPKSVRITDGPTGNRLVFLPQTGRTAVPTANQPSVETVILTLETSSWSIDVTVPVGGSSHIGEIEKI